MAAHRARVAEAEVDVLVAVDVGEAAPARLGDEEREPAGPLGHPVHRDAGQEMPFARWASVARTRMLAREALLLAALGRQGGTAVPADPGIRLRRTPQPAEAMRAARVSD